jgi:hypothetical protein
LTSGRIADDIGFAAEKIEVECRNVGTPGDFLGGFRRDHAAARLGFCKCDLDFDVARDQAEVRKHLTHGRGAEGVAEQDGVEDGCGGGKGGHGVLENINAMGGGLDSMRPGSHVAPTHSTQGNTRAESCSSRNK